MSRGCTAGGLGSWAAALLYHAGALCRCRCTHPAPLPPPPPLQYYDVPSLSVRSAVFPLMQAGVPGFRPDKIWLLGGKGSKVSASGDEIPKAAPEERPLFFYADR